MEKKKKISIKSILSTILAVIGFFIYKKFIDPEEFYYSDYEADIVLVNEEGKIEKRTELPQAWSDKEREAFWFTSQGSEILPYKWFTWLEQPTNTTLFRDAAFIESLGYLPQKTSKFNPSGLPIGFAITRYREDAERGMGFTCAACHTNQLNYQGHHLLIEGAPTLANFVKLLNELSNALAKTYADDDKFNRFAKRVLEDKYTTENLLELRNKLQKVSISLSERISVNALPNSFPKDFTSYGRVDAFGNIANAGSAFALHDLANKHAPTGPVSYPFLWGTHQSNVVQWNASAPNTPVVGPLSRNIGEVVGVFGQLNMEESSWIDQLLGVKVRYTSQVDFKGLGTLETLIKDLRSPQWPETYLPKIDTQKAGKGALLFDQHCVECHTVIPREKEGENYIANKTLLSDLGTDPITAWNIANHKANTLMLEGTKEHILIGKPFEKEAIAIEIPVNGVFGLVLNNSKKAINAGFAPLKNGNTEESDIEALLKEHGKRIIKQKNNIPNKHNNTQPPNALGINGVKLKLDSLVYKGRPLNGIWATAPYLHNGSIPNLWQLLVKPEDRIKEFHVGNREFDAVNVGYIINEGPSVFKVLKNDGSIMPGNSNLGHLYGTDLTDEEKWNLIEFMKTL